MNNIINTSDGLFAGLTAIVTYNSGTGKYDVALSKGTVTDSVSLTVSIHELTDPDITAVTNAKDKAESAVYSNMTQEAATSEAVIANALKTSAETAVNDSSVTATIKKISYIAPVAGNGDTSGGTNGSYIFAVTVAKGLHSQTTGQKSIIITATPFTGASNGEAVAAAKAALINGTVNVALGAKQTAKTATVQSYVNNILSTTAAAAGVTAIVTYNSTTGNYDVALSKGGASDSKSLSMTVNESADPDLTAVTNGKNAAEGPVYSSMTQAAATSEAVIANALKTAAETAVNDNSVTVNVNQISYTAPTAGDEDTPNGTDGSYTFTVTVSKGLRSQTTDQKSITITATPFTGVSNGAAVAAAKAALISGTVNVVSGADQTAKTAAVQDYVNNILSATSDAAGVTAIVIYNSGTGNYDVALSKDGASDSKSLSMTVTAGYTISGTIKGSDTNSGIAGATVQLKSGAGAVIGTITANADGGYIFPPLPTGDYSIEASATGYNSGTISGIVVSNANVTGKDLTLTKAGGGGTGGGGGGGGSYTPPPKAAIPTDKQPNMPTTVKMSVSGTVKDGVLSATITGQMVQDAIKAVQDAAKKSGKEDDGIAVEFGVTASGSYTSLNAAIDAGAIDLLKEAGVKFIKIGSDVLDVTLDAGAIAEIDRQSTGTVTVSATRQTKLSQEASALIGSRPVFDITVGYQKNGKTEPITDFGKGAVTLGIAYNAAPAEATGNLFGVYVDKNGKPQLLTNSSYAGGRVIFDRNSLSTYGVGYKATAPTFTDTAKHWAKNDIDFVTSRGLIGGTSATTFAPDTAITRADFLMALGKLSGADVSIYQTSSFTDVKATDSAMPYMEWAVKNKIVSGYGNGKFGPSDSITREQMAVMMVNYANATGYKLPIARQAVTFADDAKISTWAKEAVKAIQQTDIIVGKTGNLFDPQAGATRGEASTILRRFVELVITTE